MRSCGYGRCPDPLFPDFLLIEAVVDAAESRHNIEHLGILLGPVLIFLVQVIVFENKNKNKQAEVRTNGSASKHEVVIYIYTTTMIILFI